MIKVLALTDDEANIDRMVKCMAAEIVDDVFIINYAANTKYLYEEYWPDIILLDLHISDLPGGEVLRYLALHDSISAIVMISNKQGEVIDEIIQLGESLGLKIFGVLTKPIEADAFKKILFRYLGMKSGSK